MLDSEQSTMTYGGECACVCVECVECVECRSVKPKDQRDDAFVFKQPMAEARPTL